MYNPQAGRLPALPIVECAAGWWRSSGWEAQIVATHGPGEATAFARRAAESGFDAVIVAGGDGTVSQAAEGLAGSPTALGILPIGTSNVWAREMGLPSNLSGSATGDIEAVARLLAEARVLPIDVGRLGERHFLLWAGVGLDGHIVSRVEPRTGLAKQLGQPYYVTASFIAGVNWPGAPMRVEVDGEAHAGHYLLVLVGNNRRYGGGIFNISPQARVDDGLFEVWTFEGRGYFDTLALARELYRGRHAHHPRIHCRAGRRILITAGRPLPAQCDGESLGERRQIEIEVAPRALRVLVPATAPADLFISGNS